MKTNARKRSTAGQRQGRARTEVAPRILVPVDFSLASRRAVDYASAIGSRRQGAMTLLHVVKPITCQADFGYGPVTREIPDEVELRKQRAKLRRISSRMKQSGCAAKPVVLSGFAPDEIARAARTMGTDLIIMGCQGKGEADGRVGSTAEEVVRNAPCPVFVVKGKECGAGK